MSSSSSSTRVDNPSEAPQGVSQISKQQQQRAAIPQIEVVNEIQIIINKKDQRSLNVTTPSDSKDIKKCISSRSSKTDLTALTTPTTATLDTAKTSKSGRRASREKDKSESSSICVCGKLLKRVKGLLERKEKNTAGEEKDVSWMIVTWKIEHICNEYLYVIGGSKPRVTESS